MSINTSINIGFEPIKAQDFTATQWSSWRDGSAKLGPLWFCRSETGQGFSKVRKVNSYATHIRGSYFQSTDRDLQKGWCTHCNDSHYGIDDQWPHVAFFNHGTPRNMIGPHIPRKEEQFHAWGFVILGRMVTSIIWPTDRIWPKRHGFFFRNKIGIATAKELDDAGFDQQK